MTEIGIIKSILNKEYVLVESSEYLDEGDELEVFTVVSSEKIKIQTGLDKLSFSKGTIVVNSRQGDMIYLCSTAVYEPVKKVEYEDPLASSMLGSTIAASLMGIRGKKREYVESVPKSNPVIVDNSQSLKIDFQRAVTVGDKVARKRKF